MARVDHKYDNAPPLAIRPAQRAPRGVDRAAGTMENVGMRTSLQRIGWRLLTGVAAVYAVLAILVGFAPAIAAGWRVTRPAAGHGNISVSMNQSLILHFDMTATHSSPWSGSVNLPVVALCAFGPLVILWIIAIVRSRRGDAIIRS